MATDKTSTDLNSVLDTLDLDNIDNPGDVNPQRNNSDEEKNKEEAKRKEEEELAKKKKEDEEKQQQQQDNKDSSDNKDDSSDDSGDEGSDEPSLNAIAKKLGVFEEEEIKTLALEDSEEGILKLVTSAVDKQKQSIVDEAFSIHEDLANLRDYISNGGNPEDFYRAKFENISYSSITLKEEDVAMQKTILGDYLKTKGYSPEELAEEVKEADDSGILFKKASRALESLKALKKEEEEQLTVNLEKQKQEYEASAKKMWEEIETTVNKATTLKGIPLSPAGKKELLDYVRVGKEGVSKYNEDLKALKPDEVMAVAYLIKNKLDFASVFKNLVKTQASNTIKDILQKSNSNKQGRASSKQHDLDQLDV